MKKENIYKFLYLVSVLLIIGFIIRLGVDYFEEGFNDTFYNLIVERSRTFLLPSFIFFVAARSVKKIYNKEEATKEG